MTRSTDATSIINLDAFAQDVSRIEDLSDRVRLAGYGLAAPLVAAREAQMEREVARTAMRKGPDHPEVALRRANADRAEARFALFSEELARARISRPEFDQKQGAAIWGRVVDDGAPQAGLTVSAIGDGVRLGFACTDALGGFSLALPGETGLVLSVKSSDGAELYRDPEASELQTGQQQYREIDLTRGAEPPCRDPGTDTPPDTTFKMLDLVGRPEAAALSLLANQGLQLGKRATRPAEGQEGLVLSHTPEAGATVSRGDAVDIVVGAADHAQVPDLIGLTLERAQALLKKAGLAQGELAQVPVLKERAGLIVDQTPLPGAAVAPGSAVNLSIGVAEGGSPDLVTVPDVTGGTLDAASAALKKSGLKRGDVSEVPVPGDRVGVVVGQSPEAGSQVAPDTGVALILGAPAPDTSKIPVPDLRGKSLGDAEAILAEVGLKPGARSERPSDKVSPGAVLDQDPPPGSLLAEGDAVALVIAVPRIKETPRVEVPKVIGMDLERAAARLKAADLGMTATERAVNAPAQVGIVLAQTPREGTVSPVGATVSVTVGTRSRPGIDHDVARVTDLAQAELIGAGVLPADSPGDALATRLEKAGVKTLADVDRLIETDRRELRKLLGLRTLAQTDQAIAALRRARARMDG